MLCGSSVNDTLLTDHVILRSLKCELWFLVLVQLNLVASLSESSLVATSCSSQGNCSLG